MGMFSTTDIASREMSLRGSDLMSFNNIANGRPRERRTATTFPRDRVVMTPDHMRTSGIAR